MAARGQVERGFTAAQLVNLVATCRRVILVEVQQPGGKRASGGDLLWFGAARVPVVAIDLDTRTGTKTGEIVKVTEVGRATAWRDIPTPGI